LTAALPIGGIVRNEAGEPISGATIELRSFRSGSSGRLDLHPYPARTDAQGRWWFDQAPDDPLSLSIRISHPDYVDKSYFIYRDAAPRKALREKTWTTMLTEGISITGVILNGKGQPIGGARIGLGGLDQELYPIVTSNKKGLFRTERVATGESFQLIAAATGRAPALIEIESEPDMDPVEFRLEPGYTIRGRVVDESGAPLPGAMIDIYRWRGQYLTLHCKARTKGAGRFELKDAPPDPVFASITRWDHQPLRDVELSPSIRPLILTLESQYRVRGRVTDAETGRPIPEFTIFKRFVDEDGEANRWYRRDRIYGALGRYDIHIHRSWPQFALRVEADGYLPTISDPIQNGEQVRVVDLTLHGGQGTSIRILTPSGENADNALVVAFTAKASVYIQNGILAGTEDAIRKCRTTDQGVFSIPPEREPYKVLALHASGVVEFTDERFHSNSINLEKWGRIQGSARIGRNPASGATLKLWYPESDEDTQLKIDYRYETTADQEGRFKFDKVKPGRVCIGRMLEVPGNDQFYAICMAAPVSSGDLTRLQVGGTGRHVHGQLRSSSKNYEQIDWRYTKGVLKRVGELDVKARDNPDEDESVSETEPPYYMAFCTVKDGSFRVDDVLPGKYDFDLEVYAAPKHEGGRWGVRIGKISQPLKIPPIPDVKNEKPFEIGTLKVALRRLPEVGRPVPPLEIKTVDGKKIRLRDYRGKVVLLHFWATWCGPCKAEIPHLKDIYKTFGTSRHFEIINLSLDNDPLAPAAFVKKNDLKWVQGFLGKWSDTTLPNEYGVTGIPASFLVDPEGKLVAKDLRSEDLKRTVTKAINDFFGKAR
jgi:thiol-disulfide isomerase/thioredoxin